MRVFGGTARKMVQLGQRNKDALAVLETPESASHGGYPMTTPQCTHAPATTQEEWRPVVGWEGHYEVSNLGRVRHTSGRIKLARLCGGYPRVSLYRNGERLTPSVHGMVAAAFIGPRPIGCQVNHKDGDRTHNTAGNLEYLTASENNLHKNRILGSQVGERNPRAKLTWAVVAEVRRRYRNGGVTQRDLAGDYGVNHRCIGRIIAGEIWVPVEQEGGQA